MTELSEAWHSPYGAQTVDLAIDYIAELEAENKQLKEKLKDSHKVHPLNPLINGGV